MTVLLNNLWRPIVPSAQAAGLDRKAVPGHDAHEQGFFAQLRTEVTETCRSETAALFLELLQGRRPMIKAFSER
ncbi:hypothetical protein EN828_24820 [Mesorhizobium sp. M2D.F.Ca.ET.185.01.1.1]|uniref:hypothetical protein n=1 Tax=unclassified Mesorhizobium TaxID=325217 RepID=UPI000FCC25D1|nr:MULTISPECIES: hypothetical protein [unclassified Mesorhizobium]TGP75757.1 hypothetical protein EN870_23910 [bacterium M00.F.Ca.ET.227.01.1.1]TGP87238.1 hypothetical protein EN864_23675 [bacterium M00.F.Ca.ET.221.01.1.1]TGP91730.1 hypothetical protein EN865_22345 [bacterium M00.F.Ca.ET.222.01.1.1]TGT69965.1 hypothetical protein EN802_22480 [bacterium M00.F.Ca.ET.159.01.1.1]TGT81916.1 hypothetical protein EN800_20640 [bacterium M00.F.Ca.ET.157.01.1.1]TGU05385.1 hypothetical protein EN806_376